MKLGVQNIENSSLPELGPSNSVDLSLLKVMIIDDSKTIRKSAETLLVKEGCEVLTAVDGFEALAIIAVNFSNFLGESLIIYSNNSDKS